MSAIPQGCIYFIILDITYYSVASCVVPVRFRNFSLIEVFNIKTSSPANFYKEVID